MLWKMRGKSIFYAEVIVIFMRIEVELSGGKKTYGKKIGIFGR